VAEGNAGKAGVVLAGAALVASAISLAKNRIAKAAPGENGPVTLDEETMQLLIAMAQTSAEIEQLVAQVLGMEPGQPGQLSLQVAGYPPNTESMIATRVQVPVLGRHYRLPDIAVPDDFLLQLKGWPTNLGTLYVGNSQGTVTNINQVWPLLPNEAIGYRVKNARELYVAGIAPPAGASVIGDWLVITVEQGR